MTATTHAPTTASMIQGRNRPFNYREKTLRTQLNFAVFRNEADTSTALDYDLVLKKKKKKKYIYIKAFVCICYFSIGANLYLMSSSLHELETKES